MSEAGLAANAAPEELHWKYWQARPDWPGPRSFVMARGSDLLAHAALIPGVCILGGRRLRLIHVIDWAARTSASGVGVSLMKHMRHLADGMLALGGSAQTLRILPYLGFRSVGSATQYVRALRPTRILVPSVHNPWRVPLRFVRSALWTLAAPSTRVSGWQACRVEPDGVHELRSLFPSARPGWALFARSEELFRYMLSCPIAAMELYAMDQGGRRRGYFLLAFAFGQARLADCWMDSEEAADWRALIDCAVVQSLRHRQVAELVAWASDATLAGYLEATGFHPRGAVQAQILAAPDVSFANTILRVQMIENDAAYRHPGRNEFLA